MLLAAQTAAEGQGGILGTLGSFLPIILMFVVFYFVLIRPRGMQQAASTTCSFETSHSFKSLSFPRR
jgi:hypothetical protein